MTISPELQSRLRDERGVYAVEACDRCGQILGAVRFTRAGDSGVWCSRKCRGDGEGQGQKIHKGGRPRKYKHDRARKNAHARQQREFRLRSSVTKTCRQPDANKGLTDAILTICYGGTRNPENGIIAETSDLLPDLLSAVVAAAGGLIGVGLGGGLTLLNQRRQRADERSLGVPLLLTLAMERLLNGETIAALVGGLLGLGIQKSLDNRE